MRREDVAKVSEKLKQLGRLEADLRQFDALATSDFNDAGKDFGIVVSNHSFGFQFGITPQPAIIAAIREDLCFQINSLKTDLAALGIEDFTVRAEPR
jgi:hypothetical protein